MRFLIVHFKFPKYLSPYMIGNEKHLCHTCSYKICCQFESWTLELKQCNAFIISSCNRCSSLTTSIVVKRLCYSRPWHCPSLTLPHPGVQPWPLATSSRARREPLIFLSLIWSTGLRSTPETQVSFTNLWSVAKPVHFCLSRWKRGNMAGRMGIAAWQQRRDTQFCATKDTLRPTP